MKSVFNTPTLQPPRRIPSPIIYEGDENEDEDDYFFSPNEGDLDENGDIEDASPSSRGSELYYTPSISPASVRSADRSPAFMQTPVKHDRSNATQTPSSVSKSSHRTPKQQHQQRIPMIRTPGKVVSNAQRQMSDDAKSVHDAKIHSKWMSMLNNWGFTVMFRSGTLRRRLRRGIPPDLRPVAWHRLCVAVVEASAGFFGSAVPFIDTTFFWITGAVGSVDSSAVARTVGTSRSGVLL